MTFLSGTCSYAGVKLDSKRVPTEVFRTYRAKQAAIRQRCVGPFAAFVSCTHGFTASERTHRIVKIVKKWIDLFYSDFLSDERLLERLEAFEKMVSILGGGKSTSWQTLCIARVRLSRLWRRDSLDERRLDCALRRDPTRPRHSIEWTSG